MRCPPLAARLLWRSLIPLTALHEPTAAPKRKTKDTQSLLSHLPLTYGTG